MRATTADRARFASRFARLREKRGISQREVAEELANRGFKITDRAVSGWERGVFAPENRQMTAALDDLLDGKGQLLDALGYTTESELEERVADLEAKFAEIQAELRDRPAGRPADEPPNLAKALARLDDLEAGKIPESDKETIRGLREFLLEHYRENDPPANAVGA